MTVKKVEIMVSINCGKCNSAILEAVTDIEGVNLASLDEGKSILTVIGTMDPVCVATRLKKIKQKPVIVSVGPPPKPPEPPKPPVPEKPKPPPEPKHVCQPPYCNSCDVVSVTTYESGSGCTIL